MKEVSKMTIDTIDIIKLINRLHDYADVALFGAMKDGYKKALCEVGSFISTYEEHEDKCIAKNYGEDVKCNQCRD
jgi:hypothetical protein